MTDLTIFISLTLLAVLSWSIFGMSTKPWKQKLSTLCFVLFVLGSIVSGLTLLGQPRPVDFNLNNIKGEIIAYSVIKNVQIWLWVFEDSKNEPTYYSMPWSEEDEKRLKESFDGREEGGEVRMDLLPRGNEQFFHDDNALFNMQFTPPTKG